MVVTLEKKIKCGAICMLEHQTKHKTLVKIVNVKLQGAEVPFQHRDWVSGKLTLGDSMDRAIDSNSNIKQINKRIEVDKIQSEINEGDKVIT